MKKALIIQGPLVTSGLSGASLHPENTFSGCHRVENFDCVQPIMENIGLSGDSFDEIILSTWPEADTSKLSEVLGLRIRKCQTQEKVLVKFADSRPNNKLKQARGVLEGLLAAEKAGCEFAVRVRTDQVLDCARLLEDSIQFPEKITVPYYDSKIPFFIQDFFIAGTVENLRVFYSGPLTMRAVYRSAHYDHFFRYLILKHSNWFKLEPLSFFPGFGGLMPSQLSLIKHAWDRYFRPAPVEIWNGLKWRGVKNSFSLETVEPEVSLAEIRTRKGLHLNWAHLAYFLFGDKLGAPISVFLKRLLRYMGRLRNDFRRRMFPDL